MSVSMATGFAKAAENNPAEARAAIEIFGDIQFEYRREVHAHSHWISLGMLLMVLGMAFNLVALNERYKFALAVSLLAGAVFFPLGVILQIFHMGLIAKLLSIAGTFLVIVSLAVITWGFFCPMPTTRMPTSDN